MAQILISKIKTRRGLDSQIKTTVYDQGELVSSIDTQRLFIGTGTGSYVVGSKFHLPLTNFYSISTVRAEVGDVVSCNNKVYQLTATDYTNFSNWKDVTSLSADPTIFSILNNTLTLNTSSISANYLNSSTVLSGVKISDGILQANLSSGLKLASNSITLDYNTKSLEISSGALSLKGGGIDEREIATSALSSGLSGGGGSKIGINANPTYFQLSSGQLDLKISGISASLSSGLDVDTTSITRTSGKLAVNNSIAPGTQEWARITVNGYGLVNSLSSSIYDCLTSDSSLSSYNSTSPLSSIFNGTPNISDLSSSLLSSNVTYFTAVSVNGLSSEVITLTSAGFITFQNSQTTRTGKTVTRFAIPIFAY